MRERFRWWWWSITRKDKWWLFLARRCPRSLQYWCAILVGAHATQGEWSNQIVPDLKFMEALERWDA